MKRQICYAIITAVLFFGVQKGVSQVYINEFLASNTGKTVDPDFNESADWIELYNAGSESVNIGGYFLTDNFNDRSKWQIPAGTQIGAGGFLLLWADGRDTLLHTGFKISADGEELALCNPQGEILDSVSFGLQEPNISMGRKPDGGAEWNFFTEPSPGYSNSTQHFEGIVKSTPLFKPLGGIFSSPVPVSVTNTFGGEIRYTTDGSEPTENSPLLTSDLKIDTTTVVRARIFQAGKVPGKIITHTYFIDSDNSIGKLPVVSLTSNPQNFWDPEKGIYVQDFKPEWEIPVNIELFENDGSDRAGFNLAAGVKINGLYSWQLPQKMLGVYFRKEYGESHLNYPLLFDHDRTSFDDFALRASGSDWAYTLFRDGMTQSLTAENMNLDFQGFRASVVYFNGKYMGIHNIRSKVNEDFIVQNHRLGDRKIDMVENENYAEAGTLDQYAAFEQLYHKDLSVQENFDAVAALMDIENFTDFIITEIYSQNTSVDHNIMAWKPQDGGKWKWILNDLDRGFFNAGSNLISFYADRDVYPFSDLLKNEGYRHYFGKRLADHLFTTFAPERVKNMIQQFKTNIEEEVPKHIERWRGTGSNYGDAIPSVEYWENQVQRMNTFADNRPSVLINDLQNYGFEPGEALSVFISPEKAGTVDFNGIKIKQSASHGNYPRNEEIELVATAKSGYIFRGWQISKATTIIDREENWKYNDSGEALPEGWNSVDFDDSDWKEGQAELGYGDNDENTVVEYGADRNNKFITTWFRKQFKVENPETFHNLKIKLKCDDGAVIYLNGTEVARDNMPEGEILFSTTAIDAIGGAAEDDFRVFQIDEKQLLPGRNIIAAEVHQANSTSSDISFDLILTAFQNDNLGLNPNPVLNYLHTEDTEITAVFENDGSCIVPEEISGIMILDKDCSPYRIPDNVTVTETGTLVINPGVELWFSDGISMNIHGKLEANGTKAEPVIFKSNPAGELQKWGILNFVNADTSRLNHIIIENASKGANPIREIAAVSAFHSVLIIDGAEITNVHENPVLGRYSDVTLKNSQLHSEITGDLINLKYGKGLIDSCDFTGNDMPDTDAVDFDDIQDGIIRNSVIRNFHGFNSDAIDIGEQAENITIENMLVYNITDKGVSVGQQSSAKISNSVFVNCNLGAGLKDSCRVSIDHCTYYGNGTPVACFEKNEGDAGGNAMVIRSILSNSYDASYFSDSKSRLVISSSASDNDLLPAGYNNLFVEPQFQHPDLLGFELSPASPCRNVGAGEKIGATLEISENFSQPVIRSIAYLSGSNPEITEYIELFNPGALTVNLSGYRFTKGIEYTFPENTLLMPGENLFVAFDSTLVLPKNENTKVYQWTAGRLANEGEIIRLESSSGIVIDQVHYNLDDSWPVITEGEGITLKSVQFDNHFGSNWKKSSLHNILANRAKSSGENQWVVYPNPTTGIVNISGLDARNQVISVFNQTGNRVKSEAVNNGHPQVNLSGLPAGIYFLRCESGTFRIILVSSK